MCLPKLLLPVVALVLGPLAFADDAKPAGPITVDLPGDTVILTYVETPHGMMLTVDSGVVSMQAKRLYLGDGKVSVLVEATENGWFVGGAKVAGAQMKIKQKATVTADKLYGWEKAAGEVYVLAPGVTFSEKGK